MKINCMIVDDEPLSQDVIETYIKDFPLITLVRKCSNAIEALEALKQENIQLIFLDIKMPSLSGINMLKSIPSPPCVIFTTAYAQHALEGFELNAVDYLLKPFSFERFVQAVNKACRKIEMEALATSARKEYDKQDFIVVKADKRLHKINFEDIVYFNSIGDYLKIFLKTGKVIVTNETLKNIEASLPSNLFVRIHKSYIVSVKSIQYIEGNQVVIEDVSLPIGLTYKEHLISSFGGRS
jgi:DNA-binding LytR/AlgR family response regulator